MERSDIAEAKLRPGNCRGSAGGHARKRISSFVTIFWQFPAATLPHASKRPLHERGATRHSPPSHFIPRYPPSNRFKSTPDPIAFYSEISPLRLPQTSVEARP